MISIPMEPNVWAGEICVSGRKYRERNIVGGIKAEEMLKRSSDTRIPFAGWKNLCAFREWSGISFARGEPGLRLI